MRIMLISRDRGDLWKHEYFRDYLQQQFPDIAIKIICGEPDKQQFEPKPDVHYIFTRYEAHLKKYEQATDGDIISWIAIQGSVVPGSLYKSDRRYVHNLSSERELALEQIYLVEQAQQSFQAYQPDFLFMTGGGNLIRNVFFLVGQALGVRCYRILNAIYLNPDRRGIRYWFSTNNYCRLSDNATDKFNYVETDTCKHARELLDSIQKVKYNLSQYARTTARRKRMSSGFKRVTRDIIGAGAYQLFKVQRGYQAWSRLQSLKNFALNKRLITPPTSIPKPFFLFPLNVPEDAQLVLRTPHFRDLLSICEQIANVLPYGFTLVIKGHPGHPGMLDHNRLKTVLKYHPNMVYISGEVQLWELLGEATALITINSTAALEALVNDIPVITLGEAFYRKTNLTYDVGYLLELPKLLTGVIADPQRQSREKQLLNTLVNLLQETVPAPGIIESTDDNNYLRVIAKGIAAKVEQSL